MKSTGTIIWVSIGAAALAAAYTLVGGPTYVANLIVGYELPAMGVILFMMLIFLVMGMFMDWVGIVLLIMPVFLPIVRKLPIEEIGFLGTLEPRYIAVWFGVVFCMNMQVSFLSPPFGPAAFYLKSVALAHISLTDIFRGFLPFIGIQLAGTFGATYLATNCNGVFRVSTARLCPFGKNHISPIWHLSPQMGVFICKGAAMAAEIFLVLCFLKSCLLLKLLKKHFPHNPEG